MESLSKETSTEEEFVRHEVEFSVIFRLQHWVRVLAITVLIISGFYLAYPMLSQVTTNEPTNFMYALIRSWHIIFGFVLISAFIVKIYIFFFGKLEVRERESFRDVFSLNAWIRQIGYYLLLCKRPKLRGAYNPLQFAAYFLFYVLTTGLIITGLILYVHVYHEGLGGFLYEPMRAIEVMLGGLAVVRELHHIFMWGVILFIVTHLYLVSFNTIYMKEGAIDAIFSGLKWHKKHK
jgi:Ni/Fe-hydrogenase 1 B-type cytochrome subunit